MLPLLLKFGIRLLIYLFAQVPNPSVAALYEDALVFETGSAITSTGALTAYSGAKTGRSPLDKRIVKEPGSENDIWWGPVNKPMTPDVRTHLSNIQSRYYFVLYYCTASTAVATVVIIYQCPHCSH
jgi:ATP-dependent phosphoenolpyruvate carboxykinase